MTIEEMKTDIQKNGEKMGYSKHVIAHMQEIAEVAYLVGRQSVLYEQLERLKKQA